MSIFDKCFDIFKLESTREIEYNQKVSSGEICPDVYRLYSVLSIVFVDFFLLLSGGHHDNIQYNF